MTHRASPDAPVQAAMLKLEQALPLLALALVAHGEPASAPFARLSPFADLAGPPKSPGEMAEEAIMLVHAVFFHLRASSALTAAAKRVGNAALGVKRALAIQAARRDRIALREAARLPVPVRRARAPAPAPQARAL